MTTKDTSSANRFRFRGLSVNGEWRIGLLSISQGLSGQPEKGQYLSNDAGMPWAYQVRPETVGQSTGLTDKNGKEIFEGDVVLQVATNGHDQTSRDVGAVTWDVEGCDYNLEGPNGFKVAFGVFNPYLEVIGNIYENPDLLPTS